MTPNEVELIALDIATVRKVAQLMLSTAAGTELLLKLEEHDYSPHEIAMQARIMALRELGDDLLALLPENH